MGATGRFNHYEINCLFIVYHVDVSLQLGRCSVSLCAVVNAVTNTIDHLVSLDQSIAEEYPGFPVGGGTNPPGTPTDDFVKFSKKLHEIEGFKARMDTSFLSFSSNLTYHVECFLFSRGRV